MLKICIRFLKLFSAATLDLLEVKEDLNKSNHDYFRLSWDLARDMGAIYSMMDIEHSSMVSRVCFYKKEVGVISKGHDERKKYFRPSSKCENQLKSLGDTEEGAVIHLIFCPW